MFVISKSWIKYLQNKLKINDEVCFQFLDEPSSTEPTVATTTVPTDIGKTRAGALAIMH